MPVIQYPSWVYSSTDPPQLVTSAAQLATLPPSYNAITGGDAALPPNPVLPAGSPTQDVPLAPDTAGFTALDVQSLSPGDIGA